MPSDAKVYEVGVALFVNDDVFWFEIAVDDVAAVEGLEGVEEAANDEFLILRMLLIWCSLKDTFRLM